MAKCSSILYSVKTVGIDLFEERKFKNQKIKNIQQDPLEEKKVLSVYSNLLEKLIQGDKKNSTLKDIFQKDSQPIPLGCSESTTCTLNSSTKKCDCHWNKTCKDGKKQSSDNAYWTKDPPC